MLFAPFPPGWEFIVVVPVQLWLSFSAVLPPGFAPRPPLHVTITICFPLSSNTEHVPLLVATEPEPPFSPSVALQRSGFIGQPPPPPPPAIISPPKLEAEPPHPPAELQECPCPPSPTLTS